MILQWMAYTSACAALVGAAADCAERTSASGRVARRWVWSAAIALSTIVPFALPVARDLLAPTTTLVRSTAAATTTAPPPPSSQRLDVALFGAWVIASTAFALLLIVAHWRTRLMLRGCRRGMVAGREALISRDFGPALVGTFAPRMVVPEWVLALDSDEQRLVVLHELEHARSRDPLLALAGVLAVAAMPWNAVLWWQLSRLRLAIELDCDMRIVARQRGDAIAYSRLLLHVRERGRAMRQPALALSHSRSSLGKRLDALLDRHHARLAPALTSAALAACLVAVVGFVPTPHLSGVLTLVPRRSEIITATPVIESAQPPVAVRTTPPPPAERRAAPRVAPRKTRGATLSSVQMTAIANAEVPPVRVVPSNPLAGVTAGAAVLPRRVAGVRAGAAGAGGFMGGAAMSGRGAPPSSAAAGGFVVRATARPSAPPDTIRPPF